MHWILLALGITVEIATTMSLKLSNGFTNLFFAAATLIGFGVAFYLMSLVVKTMPVAIAYSIWAGGGVAGVLVASAILFGERIDGFAYLGIGLIVSGVIVLNTLSASANG